MPTTPDSEVVKVIRAHRLGMNAQEEAVIENLGSRWLGVERAIESNVNALANEMTRRAQAGETITNAMAQKAERYAILKAQLQQEVAKYNKDAAVIISGGQDTALRLGITSAQDAIYASYPSPLSASFNRINVKAVESMIGYAGNGSPLSSLLKNDYPDAVDGLLQSLVNGVAMGQTADQVARNMADGMGMGLDRSLLIARTEINRAYRTGSTEQYRESGVTSGFMRLVARDEACLACLALDGERFDSADEMDDHPNGRCTCVPIVAGVPLPEWEKADTWLANQSEDKQRAVLGNTRYEMYKAGTPLSAFGKKAHSDEWGDSPSIIPLRDLSGVTDTRVIDDIPQAKDFDVASLRESVMVLRDEQESAILEKQSEVDQIKKTTDDMREEKNGLWDLYYAAERDGNTADKEFFMGQIEKLSKEQTDLYNKMHLIKDDIRKIENDLSAKARSLLAVESPINTKVTGNMKLINERIGNTQDVFNLVDASIMKGENQVAVKFKAGRAYYADTQNDIVLSKSSGLRVFAHEFGHFLEDEAALREAASQYLDSRTAGESAVSLRKLTGNKGYQTWEVTKPDQFKNPYTGKIYPSGHTEIISMGLEQLYNDPVKFANEDPDYFDFMVKTLRGR